MARRAAKSPRKPKPAKAKKGKKGKKAAPVESEDLEVTAEGVETASAGPSLESGLVLVTFIALIVALVLIEMEMSSSYGSTWPL